jgi:hypothetical protein
MREAHLAPCLDLEPVRGGTRSVGYRQRDFKIIIISMFLRIYR